MSGERPLAWVAIFIWAASAVSLLAGVILAIRRRRAEISQSEPERGKRMATYLISLAVFGGLAGIGAFYAAPGELGSAQPELVEPRFEISPAASPLVLPQQPAQTETAGAEEVPTSSSPEATKTSRSGPFQVGFDSVGEVRIGGAEESIRQVYGEPTSVRPDDTLGKTLKAYVYEESSFSLTIYTFEGKVVYYAARSPNFETISGVKVGDSVEKLRQTYGSKLEEVRGGFRLSDSKGKVVVFLVDGQKITSIEGGNQIG